VVFYLDASIPIAVSMALALVRDDVLYPGGPNCPITTPGVRDDGWLPVAGHHGWLVLMRDKHVRRRPGELQALQKNSVRAFVLTGAGNYSRWRTLDLLVRRWSEIESTAAVEVPPYIYAVTQQGLRRVEFGSSRRPRPGDQGP
jgi:PIN like domain